MKDSSKTEARRPIRSFVKREGRMTPGQKNALETHFPHYGLTVAAGVLEVPTAFPVEKPIVLEIGFGMGESLLHMACAYPEYNYIGVEVHRPGVGALLLGVAKAELNNLRVYAEDAIEVLERAIPDASLERVHIYFPDPWHKKKHHKRRLIQPDFIALIQRKLVPNGVLHMATDWENYAMHMLAVMDEMEGFNNLAGHDQFSEPGMRPLTKYEARGKRLGHAVWDLLFTKV